jgi:hypothetical protein
LNADKTDTLNIPDIQKASTNGRSLKKGVKMEKFRWTDKYMKYKEFFKAKMPAKVC